jgi:hypothetical protein
VVAEKTKSEEATASWKAKSTAAEARVSQLGEQLREAGTEKAVMQSKLEETNDKAAAQEADVKKLQEQVKQLESALSLAATEKAAVVAEKGESDEAAASWQAKAETAEAEKAELDEKAASWQALAEKHKDALDQARRNLASQLETPSTPSTKAKLVQSAEVIGLASSEHAPAGKGVPATGAASATSPRTSNGKPVEDPSVQSATPPVKDALRPMKSTSPVLLASRPTAAQTRTPLGAMGPGASQPALCNKRPACAAGMETTTPAGKENCKPVKGTKRDKRARLDAIQAARKT